MPVTRMWIGLTTMPEPGRDTFLTTRWTLVLAAGGDNPEAKREALSALCAAYWSPIHAYIRSRGHGPEPAKDLTQEFFARLLEHDWLAGVTQEGSRFRAFLLVAVKRFLAGDYERQSALKRGGGLPTLSLHSGDIAEPPTPGESPESAFDRKWALTLIERALGRLEAEARASGRSELFARVSGFLASDPEPGAYEGVSQDLGISRPAVAMAVHRLRLRLREQVRSEVAETLADPRLVDDEMRQLLLALRARA